MPKNSFLLVRMDENNQKWIEAIKRQQVLYSRDNEVRSEFTRDYNRILHSTAFRRLKHKTQVFFATRNDHVCTRIEHVNHVIAVSYSIANFLGLNTELSNAIALGHDIGHAPFGHAGQEIIGFIVQEDLKDKFWHERNSLRFIDKIEVLPDTNNNYRNLCLTYAVRDGVILHCGEVDENRIYPRKEIINLEDIQEPSLKSPFTWEGCIVKISDKISYLGRDIEDALMLNILTTFQIKDLKLILNEVTKVKIRELNNTVLMHNFIVDLCDSSNPQDGIKFSEKYLKLISSLRGFNNKHIYNHERIKMYKQYAKLVIHSIYEFLKKYYRKEGTIKRIEKDRIYYPIILGYFLNWLMKYSNFRNEINRSEENQKKIINKYDNEILYNLHNPDNYLQAIVDFIASMTDNFAIETFNEITSF